MAELYYLDEDDAEDPEATTHGLYTAKEIVSRYPAFAALIVGDGTESIEYVHELWRVRVRPAYETTDELDDAQAASQGAAWADLQSETESIDGDQVL